MASSTRFALGAPGVLDLLRLAWLVYRQNLPVIAGYAGWVLLPYLGVVALSFWPADNFLLFPLSLIFALAEAALWVWFVVVMVRLANGLLNGKKAGPLRPERQAWAVMPALAVTALLQLLIIIGGLLLFVVPGIIFLVWYAFAQTIVVLEKSQPTSALSQSRELCRGRFWPVAWRLGGGPLVLFVLTSLFFGLLSSLVVTVLGLDPLAVQAALATDAPPLWIDIVENLAETLFISPLLLIYFVALYNLLKKTKA